MVEKYLHINRKAKLLLINLFEYFYILKFILKIFILITGDIGVGVITGWTRGPEFLSVFSEWILLN